MSVSGDPIIPSLIVQGRQAEVRGGVNHHVPRGAAEADKEGKFIGVRWVDVNKSTKEVPKVRKEQACGTRICTWRTERRLLCSDSTIRCSQILAVRMRELRKTRPRRSPHTYAGHQKSCLMSEGGHMVGMYGTRDALAAAWQAELENTMVGFRPVVCTVCLPYHPSLGIRVVGHVDDLMFVGPRSGLDTSWRS